MSNVFLLKLKMLIIFAHHIINSLGIAGTLAWDSKL